MADIYFANQEEQHSKIILDQGTASSLHPNLIIHISAQVKPVLNQDSGALHEKVLGVSAPTMMTKYLEKAFYSPITQNTNDNNN